MSPNKLIITYRSLIFYKNIIVSYALFPILASRSSKRYPQFILTINFFCNEKFTERCIS